MNTKKFISITKNPAKIDKEQTKELENILQSFPYFQTARILHLKGLKNQHSYLYNDSLKKTAAYTTNRTVLFDFITTNSLDFLSETFKEKNILDNINVVDSKIIAQLEKSISSTEKEMTNLIDTNHSNKKTKNTSTLKIGKPLEFTKNDAFSFNEWLKLDNKTEKEQTEIEINSITKNKKEEDLISNFIKTKPKIKFSKTQETKDISSNSISENSNLMTETLARVYIEQKKYDKAITAFKILSLKYPEKSSFFANQIKEIKKIENL